MLHRARELVLPLRAVADDGRLLTDDARDTAIALREKLAEVVDGDFGIDTELQRVRANVRARVDAGRPARKIVSLQA